MGWQGTAGQYPQVYQNVTTAPWTPSGYPMTVPPRGVALHPGGSCEVAVVRFTAPYEAYYRVSGQFYGLDGSGSQTKTAVQIREKNTIVSHTGQINLSANAPRSVFTYKNAYLCSGETLDFAVGCGTGASYAYGSIGLHAVVHTVNTNLKKDCFEIPPPT